MVSKTILACLAVIASISMIQATVLPGDFSPCVRGFGYLNAQFGLGFNLKTLFGGVLQLAGAILTGVLSAVGSINGGILGGGARCPPVPYPSNINQLFEVAVEVSAMSDSLFGRQFGSAWKSGIFADVYISLLDIVKVDVGLDVGGASFLNGARSIGDCRSYYGDFVANLEAEGAWAPLVGYLKVYVGLLSSPTVDVDVFVAAHAKLIQIQTALLAMGGFDDVDSYCDGWVQASNNLFAQKGIKLIVDADVDISGVQRDCGCISF